MATMNVAAITYLVTLRKRQGMSRARLADLIGLSVMSIGRVEKGDQEPGAEVLAKWVRAIRASWDELSHLLLSPELTDEDGRAVAYVRYAALEAGLSDEERAPIVTAATLREAARAWVADELRRVADGFAPAERDLPDTEAHP